MKKVRILLAITLLAAVICGSCQGGKKCPAYSQIKTEQAHRNS